MNLEDFQEKDYNFENLTDADKWILTKFNKLIPVIRRHMDAFKFNLVCSELYNFIWDDFCDNYIEMSKVNLNKSVLLYTLTSILKMLHPIMPFVTEEIYQSLPLKDAESIMISEYPKADKKMIFDDVTDRINNMIKIP